MMTPEQLECAYQARKLAAPHFLTWAVNGVAGRNEENPIYQDVVERRDRGAMQKKYSSCGDLPHWHLFRQGIREPWVNREENGNYRSGMNIALLQHPSSALGCEPEFFDAGDHLLIWSEQHRIVNGRDTYGDDAHAIVVAAPFANNVLPTCEYGQPGGLYRLRAPLADGMHHWKFGTRRLQRAYSFRSIISVAAAKGRLSLPDLSLLNSIAPGAVTDDVERLLVESGELEHRP